MPIKVSIIKAIKLAVIGEDEPEATASLVEVKKKSIAL